MSLINDMLRDLDQRQSTGREPVRPLPSVARPAPARKRPPTAVLAAGVLLTGGAIVAGAWWTLGSTKPLYIASSPLLDRAPEELTEPTATAALEDAVPPVQEDVAPFTQENAVVVARTEEAPVEAAPATPAPAEPELALSEAPTASTIAAEPTVTRLETSVEPAATTVPTVATTTPATSTRTPAVASEPTIAAEPEPLSVAVAHTAPAPERTGITRTATSPEQLDQHTAAQARALLQRGQVLEAEDLLRRQLASGGEHPHSRAVLAQSLLNSGRNHEAEALLHAVNGASSPTLKTLKARLLHGAGQGSAAIDLLHQQAPEVADDPDYHALLAALYQQQGWFSEAVQRYAALVDVRSDRADWWAGLGIALDGDDKRAPARRAYERALALPGLHPQLTAYIQSRLQALEP